MRNPLTLCLLATTLIAASPAPATAADAETTRALDSTITAVTVYADRAQIRREATLSLPAGVASFALSGLPGWIDEGSVRVRLGPAAAGRIVDVEIRRTYLARADDEEVRQAEEAVREIADQLAALDDEQSVLAAQREHLEAIRVFSLDKLPRDAAVRAVPPSEYAGAVEFVAESLRRVAAARRELEKKRRDLEPEREVRQRRLAELRQRTQLEQRTVVITLEGTAPREATLTVTYMLPGATWQPRHELRARRDAPTLTLSSLAAVMQTTGEDWSGVELALATQSSTETLRIPELEALLLGGGRSVARWLASGGDTFGEASRNWAAQNTAYFAARNPDQAFQEAYLQNQRVQLDAARQAEEVFGKLEQRGTTAHFAARSRQTVRSDGRRVRVPIGSVELAAKERILAAPELSLNAIRTVDLTNTGGQPLLPGKVSLYVDGAFLGLTEVDFIAPGESFAVYLGVADHVKLGRSLDRQRSELVRRGSRTRMSVSFLLRVENLADHPELIQLRDRVPVSESGEIRVSGVKVTPEGEPDAKGLLRWELNLAARQSRELRLEYTIEYPTDLPARAARVEESLEAEDLSAVKRRLAEELQALEEKF